MRKVWAVAIGSVMGAAVMIAAIGPAERDGIAFACRHDRVADVFAGRPPGGLVAILSASCAAPTATP